MARPILLTLTAALWAGSALASEDIADKYPQSVLYNKPVEVIPNVWSSIGATAPPTYENAGHNNNLSFIITGDGGGGGQFRRLLQAGRGAACRNPRTHRPAREAGHCREWTRPRHAGQ